MRFIFLLLLPFLLNSEEPLKLPVNGIPSEANLLNIETTLQNRYDHNNLELEMLHEQFAMESFYYWIIVGKELAYADALQIIKNSKESPYYSD